MPAQPQRRGGILRLQGPEVVGHMGLRKLSRRSRVQREAGVLPPIQAKCGIFCAAAATISWLLAPPRYRLLLLVKVDVRAASIAVISSVASAVTPG